MNITLNTFEDFNIVTEQFIAGTKPARQTRHWDRTALTRRGSCAISMRSAAALGRRSLQCRFLPGGAREQGITRASLMRRASYARPNFFFSSAHIAFVASAPLASGTASVS